MFGIQTTGAANDIERATGIARNMITRFGMSDKFGLMALSAVNSQYLDDTISMTCADSTASEVDSEIRDLLASCYDAAKKLLSENRSLLDEIALYLLQKETITGDEFMAYVNADTKRLSGETVGTDAAGSPSAEENH